MSLAITNLSTLDPTGVAALQAQLAGLLTAYDPNVDISRGVVREIVLGLTAVLLAAEEANVALLRQSQSLKLVAANPATADTASVDNILANFRVTRQPGQAASGYVIIVLDSAIPVVIPAGGLFAVGSNLFATSQAYAVRVDAAQVTDPADRVLTALSAGQYSFTIPVTCTTTGTAGMLRRGQAVTPGFFIPHMLTAVAASDFAGGLEPESNDDLLKRLAQGVAPACFGNRTNIAALIRSVPAFARIQAVSIVGAGDPELTRSARSIFPIMLPGRCDVYARTAPLALTNVLSVTATLINVLDDIGIWQFTLPALQAAGVYRITQIATPAMAVALQPNDPGLPVILDVRQASLPASGWAPDLRPATPGSTAVDAAYTAYQTITVQFKDATTPVAGLAIGTTTGLYSVATLAMPGIADLQALLGSRGIRPPGGDVLVRAPTPCDLSIGIELRLAPGTAAFDPTPIATAIATTVNAAGFGGTLHASTIASAAYPYLPAGAAVGPIDMFGRLRRPDGTVIYLRDPRGVAITIPEDPNNGVGARTACFFLDPAAVAVTTRTINAPQI